MTIDEIVEEFDNKFCKDGFINLGNCAIYTTTQIENWLKEKLTQKYEEGISEGITRYVEFRRRAITEAKRGVYKDILACDFKDTDCKCDIIKHCKQKLKKLEGVEG